MQIKQVFRLSAVLVALIILAWLTGTFDAAPSTVDVPSISFDASGIDRLEFKIKDEPVVLIRSGDTWEIQEPLVWMADSVTVASLIRSLGDFSLQTVVSTNPERYTKYGVDSSATVLKIVSGTSSRALVLSGKGPGYSSVYVRTDDDDRVFSATPRVSLPTTMDRLRDKRMLSIVPEAIESIDVTTPEDSYSVRREDGVWSLTANNESLLPDSSAIERWVRRFNPLRADGFVDTLPSSDSPVFRIEFQLADGTTQVVTAVEGENNLVAIVLGKDRARYKIFSSQKSILFPSISTLQKSD